MFHFQTDVIFPVHAVPRAGPLPPGANGISVRTADGDRKSTRLNSSHQIISYAVFCLKKKKKRGTSNHPYPRTAPTAAYHPTPRRTLPSQQKTHPSMLMNHSTRLHAFRTALPSHCHHT